jgi:hypothetical protein
MLINAVEDADVADNSNNDMYARTKKNSKWVDYIKKTLWLATFIAIYILYFKTNQLEGQNSMAKHWIQIEMLGLILELPFIFGQYKVMQMK